MKSLLFSSLVVLALVAGCSNDKKSDVGNKDSLAGIAPPPPIHTEIAPGGPVTKIEVDNPADNTAAAPARGQKYLVQKGDTLYSLARKTYGDGKQYKKIVAANPATIKNERLIAGTTITLP
jgi:nucleoid-associated protein YgaU